MVREEYALKGSEIVEQRLGRFFLNLCMIDQRTAGLFLQRRHDPATNLPSSETFVDAGRGERLPFNTSSNESNGKVSSDGRWIAYVTDESGKDEVWIATFPTGTIRQQVSLGGGTSPQWSGSGKELFYITDQIDNLAVVVFPTSNAYAVTSNGQRFLVAVGVADRNAPPISVVVNWRALLKR